MTITPAQQATSSAVQINQQVRMLKNIGNSVTNVLNNGASANEAQGLPGFAASDLATVLTAAEVTKLQSALAAIAAL